MSVDWLFYFLFTLDLFLRKLRIIFMLVMLWTELLNALEKALLKYYERLVREYITLRMLLHSVWIFSLREVHLIMYSLLRIFA